MNSIVELIDTNSGKRRQLTLAYPDKCELMPDAVSVLEPLGIELLGSEPGDIVSDEKCQFRIEKVIYQPEAAGARHL